MQTKNRNRSRKPSPTEDVVGVDVPRLVRPFCVGDRVSFLNGKRRGYGTIYDETPEKINTMGIPIAQQICVDTGHPRYQKFGMDVDFAAARICRTNAERTCADD